MGKEKPETRFLYRIHYHQTTEAFWRDTASSTLAAEAQSLLPQGKTLFMLFYPCLLAVMTNYTEQKMFAWKKKKCSSSTYLPVVADWQAVFVPVKCLLAWSHELSASSARYRLSSSVKLPTVDATVIRCFRSRWHFGSHWFPSNAPDSTGINGLPAGSLTRGRIWGSLSPVLMNMNFLSDICQRRDYLSGKDQHRNMRLNTSSLSAAFIGSI